ncbi:MAG: cobyrinate a,c-diamide synthase, partial [Thermoprotei archaeon]
MAHARLIVGGVGSDVGKTTVTTGLMGALAKRGLRVQGFKVGPDYIDPTYHALATGKPSYNLDTWLMGESGVLEAFLSATRDADIGVVEGVMGLFDGSSPNSDAQSTSELARILQAPVILVVDVKGVGRSAAAQVLGFAKMAQGFEIRGVILNRVGGEGHAAICKRAIEEVTGIPVVGALRDTPEIRLPSRHLGLHLAPEEREKIKAVVGAVEESLDTDMILRIAQEAPPLGYGEMSQEEAGKFDDTVRVGVAYDDAFSFYYEDNFRILRRLGAQLVFFSPQ